MLPAPPRRPTPEQLYLEHFPGLWRAVTEDMVVPPLDMEIEINVNDRGQEHTFAISFDGSPLSVRKGEAHSPVARFDSDLEAFRVAATDVWPRALRRLEKRIQATRDFLQSALAQINPKTYADTLRTLSGVIDVLYTDDAGDLSKTHITIGNGSGKLARVEVSDADLKLLLEGSKLKDLLRSRMRVHGDAGFVLRLIASLDPHS